MKKYFDILNMNLFLTYNNLKNANNIFTHLTIDEKLTLHKLGKRSKINALEIGSYLGASSCFIASSLKSNNKLFCVDTWQNDAMTEGQKDTYNTFLQNTSSFNSKILPLRGYSKDVSQTVTQKFDFAFFDGDHTYEGLLTDWTSWKNKFLPGAIVVFHDIGWAEGVKKVIAEEVMDNLKWHDSLPNMFWGELK